MKINFASRKFILLLVFIGFVWAISINEINLAYIKSENPDNQIITSFSTTFGSTIWSPDDQSYTTQIKHFLAGEGFNTDPKNPELSVRRSPVYPIFYGIHYYLFGEAKSYFYIRYSQLAIHLLAIVLFGQAIYNLSSNSIWAKFTAIFYAINPFTVTYLYATMTESLSPSFVIFVIFIFSLCHKKSSYLNYFLLGLITALSILQRPLLVLLIPALLLGLLFLEYKKIGDLPLKISQSFPFCFLFLGVILIFSPWVVRNYFSTHGDIVFLEKFYYGDQMDYGRGHENFRQWISSWTNPANFLPETYSNLVRFAHREGYPEKSTDITNKFIEDIPKTVFQINSKEEVTDAVNSLNNCYAEKEAVFRQKPNLTLKEQYALFSCEDVVSQKFETLINEYKEKAPLDYYVVVPIKLVASLIFQSGSYHFAILNPLNKQFNLFIIVAKGLMYLLSVSLFLGFSLFCLFNFRTYSTYIIFCAVFILSTLWYLAYINRYAEARYLMTLYPMLYSGLAFCLIKIFHKLKNLYV